MKKTYILFLILLFIPLISSVENVIYTDENPRTFQKDKAVDIKINLFDLNNSIVSDTANNCSLYIYKPDNSLLVSNVSMSSNAGYYNYTLSSGQINTTGKYGAVVNCLGNNNVGAISSFTFFITTSGFILSNAQAIVYTTLLFITIIFFSFCLYFGLKIPFKNNRNQEGKIVSINDFKFLKIFLLALSYIILLAIFWIGLNISEGFLFNPVTSIVFRIGYIFMYSLILPVFLISIFISFSVYFMDKKVKKRILRGIE